MKPKKVTLAMYQGATFKYTFYWYSDTEVVKSITAATNAYPTLLTAATHLLPDAEIPVSIRNVGDWINTSSVLPADRVYATKIDADTFTVKKDGTDEDAYDGTGGVLVYNAPMLLLSDNWSARMQIRESKDSDEVLVELTSDDGDITLGDDGSIAVEIDEDVLAALDFSAAVFDIELSDGTDVYRVAEGPVSLSPEVTREEV